MTPSINSADIKSLLAAQDPAHRATLMAIIDALTDVLDGHQRHDLHDYLGLPQDRCDAVSAIGFACLGALK
jgi:hypothetical protein